MKKTLLLIAGFTVLIASSCEDDVLLQSAADPVSSPSENEANGIEDALVTSFEDYGMPLEMTVDDSSLPPPQVNLNGNFGRLEVRMDDDLAFSIVNDIREIGEIKHELQQDDVFEYVFFDEGEDRLMYQAKLPTGKVVGHHYIRTLEADGERYLVATDAHLDLSHYEARRAASVINSLAAVR